MKYTTGLLTPKFADLLIRLREEGAEGYPPSMGLRDSLRTVLDLHAPQYDTGGDRRTGGRVLAHDLAAIGALAGAIARILKELLLTSEEAPQGAAMWWTALSSPAGAGGITANCGRASTGRPV